MKTKIPRVTIERRNCPHCNRLFMYAPASEIAEHESIPPKKPFERATVYLSQRGYNIITGLGRMVDGQGFSEHQVHDYIHQVATGKLNPKLGIYFEDNLKSRTVFELEKRIEEGQIRPPTDSEMVRLKEAFAQYHLLNGRGSSSTIREILEKIKPLDLIKIPIRLKLA